MKAWIIHKVIDLIKEENPLKMVDLQKPAPKIGELLIKIKTCGVCHTEIDEIEGRTPPLTFPMIPGHQVVGIIKDHRGVRKDIKIGDRVGVAWIYSSCGKCEYCTSGQENLCEQFKATGRDSNGGYAEYMVVPEDFVYKIPPVFTDAEAAPLLCAGAIGYRSLALCNMKDGMNLGLTGFGASAHLVLKLVKYIYPSSKIYVFARSKEEQKFALELGAKWAGDTTDRPAQRLHCIIDTTPAWKPFIEALDCLAPGGRLVINAIRKENIDTDYLKQLDYPRHLWMEKEIKSVANVTRKDVEEFIRIAAEIPFKPEVQEYAFDKANEAIMDIKNRKVKGGKVLIVD
ncbi:MAG: zinc-dependent alcohol dehydrogenase family protein [Bacteroidales bacterium]|nr:zinc-dependent alcohol dehydrogenase family protein [Bacteroidales bacterium]